MLLLLLVFATSTVFVRQAWAILPFQIGIYALVAAYLWLRVRRSSERLAAGPPGRVLWLFPTGYRDVYATFPYYNNYAQFIELAFPYRAVASAA